MYDICVPVNNVIITFYYKIIYRRNFGGKLGDVLIEELKLQFMGDLLSLSSQQLEQTFGTRLGYNFLDDKCLLKRSNALLKYVILYLNNEFF